MSKRLGENKGRKDITHHGILTGSPMVVAGRPGGSVGNLETFWRLDVSSNLGAVTRTGIFPHKK